MKTTLTTLIALALVFTSCRKVEDSTTDDSNINTPIDNITEMVVPSTFNWSSTKTVKVNLKALDNRGVALSSVPFSILNNSIENGGTALMSGVTNSSGEVSFDVVVPTYLKEIVTYTPYIGLQNQSILPITGNTVSYTYGGMASKSKSMGGITPKSTLSTPTRFLGTYSSNGTPDYIISYDPFDQNFLNDVNTALPENKRVPTYHPEYIASGKQTNVELSQLSDVWVTYVHEGAGWMNVLGFYTYDVNNPPATANDIDSITIMFPNFSGQNSGGGLKAGAKIKIGTFPAGTGIGWVLIANGWNGSAVTNGTYKVYSDPEFNTFNAIVSKRQQIAFLQDAGRGRYLIGFEDWRRDQSASDEDFNDAIFYVTSNPVTAIQPENVAKMTSTLVDTDGDKVADIFDASPNDPSNAFSSVYPSANGWATLAFEDLWPSKGDYDFNDAVISFRVTQLSNSNNEITGLHYRCYAAGAGASFANGFGFQLPIASNLIQSVTGTKALSAGYVTLNANGTEANQSKAVIIAFDNIHKMYSSVTGTNPTGVAGYNTSLGGQRAVSDTLDIIITFTQGIAPATLGSVPYNPFLISKADRGREIHLPNQPMTDLADITRFGTYDDNTIPGQNQYYKSKTNLPWAIHIPEVFTFPVEKVQIIKGFLKFASWAQSGGVAYPDWYQNKTGYKDTEKIIGGSKR